VDVVNADLIDLGVFGAYGSRYTYGIQAYADAGDVSIRNTEAGVIGVSARNGDAVAITGATVSGEVDIANAGQLVARRWTYTGDVMGVEARSTDGDIRVTNSGEIHATEGYTQTVGVLAQTVGGDIVANNRGLISATGEDAPIEGLRATTATGDIDIVNSGDILAAGSHPNCCFSPVGIYANGRGVTIGNGGSITVASNGGTGIGIETYGDALAVANDGEIDVSSAGSYYASGVGIVAGGAVSASVGNSGDIAVRIRTDDADRHYQKAWGIIAGSSGDVEVALHEGSTVLLDSAPYAYGVSAVSGGGAVTVDNAGAVTVVDDFDAQSDVYSMDGFAVGIAGGAADAIRITNRGDVVIDTTMGSAVGINASGSSVDVRNLGSINVDARGISGFLTLAIINGVSAGSYGDINVVNDGDLAARSSSGVATGIRATSFGDGNISLRNEGSLVAYGGGDNGYRPGATAISISSIPAASRWTLRTPLSASQPADTATVRSASTMPARSKRTRISRLRGSTR
jgi:hypothetical protein